MHSPKQSIPAYHCETCCVCDEEFSSDTDLANHLVEHAADEEFKFSLKEMEKKNKDELKRAQARKRSFSQRSGSPEVLTISDDSDDEPSTPQKAPTSFLGALQSAPVKPSPYNCPPCKLGFSDQKQYRAHLLTHEKIRPYVCQICNTGFAYKGTLRQHLHRHVAEKIHECKICNKKFSRKRMLKQHEDTHRNQSFPVRYETLGLDVLLSD